MKVRVNDNYRGTFGYYNEKYHCVEPKVAGCEPFEVSDEVARTQIKNGVLVAVDAPAPAPVVVEDEPIITAKSYEDMSFTEIKALAKERGISTFKVKRADIEAALREYDTMPVIGAADPV